MAIKGIKTFTYKEKLFPHNSMQVKKHLNIQTATIRSYPQRKTNFWSKNNQSKPYFRNNFQKNIFIEKHQKPPKSKWKVTYKHPPNWKTKAAKNKQKCWFSIFPKWVFLRKKNYFFYFKIFGRIWFTKSHCAKGKMPEFNEFFLQFFVGSFFSENSTQFLRIGEN